MKRIIATMRRVSTTILTSATSGDIPDFVGEVEHTFDYRKGNEDDGSDVVAYELISPAADKLDSLGELLRALGGRKSIVFVNHREAADRVYAYLQKQGISSCLYHGGLDQDMRERALILFENGTAPVMVATDLAARGLDIEGVEAVIHYHLPSSAEAWTHRNGRTGRLGGTDGDVYLILSAKETRPDYITTQPLTLDTLSPKPVDARATLYFNAGKKEKISRGDIAGFLISKGGLSPAEVGRIDIRDHCAYVAVPAAKARATAEAVAPHKIKNTRVRVTQLKNR